MLVNPFTARSGLDPKVFIGRKNELSFFQDDRLPKAIDGNCQHYVITGTWGIGKTVLLRQMKLQAQKQGAWALLFCTREFKSNESQTDFVRHFLDMTAADLPIQPKKINRKLSSLGGSAFGFGLQFGLSETSISLQDPQLMLRDSLLQIYEHARKKGAKALILMVDDVQNLTSDSGRLTLLRNVLTDEKIIGHANILMILSSIDQGWTPYLVRDHPVGRLFIPRRSLGGFSKEETLKLIDDSLHETGVVFEDTVKDKVFDVTGGHVFEIQALCEALFDRQIKGKVSMKNWEAAINYTLLALADAQFEGMLGRASDKELLALSVLADKNDVLGPSEIEARNPGIRNSAEILRRLSDKGLVQRIRRGKYQIFDRLFCEYIKHQRV